MAEDEGMAEVSRVRPEHRFDEIALDEYLSQNLPGFSKNHGGLTVLQYRFVNTLLHYF